MIYYTTTNFMNWAVLLHMVQIERQGRMFILVCMAHDVCCIFSRVEQDDAASLRATMCRLRAWFY
jgi:hypothetical protein